MDFASGMPNDPTPAQADRLARRVLSARLGLRPKENVTIEAYPTSLPWAAGFVREARRMGARPLLHYEDEHSYWHAVENGRASLLGTPGEHEWAALEKTNVYVYFWGPENQARLRALPDATQEKLFAFNRRWYDLAGKSGVRGVRMAIARATEENARFFGVSLPTWRKEVLAASLRDPRTLARDAERVRAALARSGSIRIEHANGTDLTLALAGREPTVFLGQVTPKTRRTSFGGLMASVPDANVLVAIDESTAEGTLVANRPTFVLGPALRGARWRFEAGRLRSANFAEGGGWFRRDFARAPAGKDRPSFVEIGLDPAIHAAPTCEESERGAVTIGVGGNSNFGGATKCPYVSYVTLAGATVSVEGERILRGGRVL